MFFGCMAMDRALAIFFLSCYSRSRVSLSFSRICGEHDRFVSPRNVERSFNWRLSLAKALGEIGVERIMLRHRCIPSYTVIALASPIKTTIVSQVFYIRLYSFYF